MVAAPCGAHRAFRPGGVGGIAASGRCHVGCGCGRCVPRQAFARAMATPQRFIGDGRWSGSLAGSAPESISVAGFRRPTPFGAVVGAAVAIPFARSSRCRNGCGARRWPFALATPVRWMASDDIPGAASAGSGGCSAPGAGLISIRVGW